MPTQKKKLFHICQNKANKGKLKMKIKHYKVEIADGSGVLRDVKNVFKCDEYNVIAENEHRLVIDDAMFTSMFKVNAKYSTCIESVEIGLMSNDSFWGNRITYSLFTIKTKQAKTIRKEIEAAIQKKYGFFMRGIDLSIIKDSK
jgi:hypothetical protein